ncbi:MAG: FkbM family methyltransferase [Pirellulales bacterium]|nr:FkbM family methyltransferase [Pirellulales bacterium]
MAMNEAHHVIVSPAVHRGHRRLDPATAALVAPLAEASRSIAEAVELLRPRCYGLSTMARHRIRTLLREGVLVSSAEPLRHFDCNGVHLVVRYTGNDDNIARTVQHEYFLDQLELPAARTLVDVGSHIGSFSCFLQHRQPQLQIVSIEAHPLNAAITRLNVGTLPNAFVHNAACGYTPADLVFTRVLNNSGGNTLIPRSEAARVVEHWRARGIDVVIDDWTPEFLTLEQVMAQHHLSVVDILKLDCEGYEFDILGKAPLEVLSRVRYIVGERHSTYRRFSEECVRRLDGMFELVNNTDLSPDMGLFLLSNRHVGAVPAPALIVFQHGEQAVRRLAA